MTMTSRWHGVPTLYQWCSVGLVLLACAWLLYAEFQPACAEHAVSWYSSCRQSQIGKFFFWWPLVATGAITLSSLIHNFHLVSLNGDSITGAWLRYMGAIGIGVGVWISLFLLSKLLTRLQAASLFVVEAAAWSSLIWGGFAILLMASIPMAAFIFFLGHRQWKADPCLVDHERLQQLAQDLERMRNGPKW